MMLEIEVPDELAATLHREGIELGAEFKLAAAVKWYELGRLSQGKAAEVAGLSRSDFVGELKRFRVSPFQETGDEVIDALQASLR